jgi:hypothetical protein
VNYRRPPKIILPDLLKCLLGMLCTDIKPEYQPGDTRFPSYVMRSNHRFIVTLFALSSQPPLEGEIAKGSACGCTSTYCEMKGLM